MLLPFGKTLIPVPYEALSHDGEYVVNIGFHFVAARSSHGNLYATQNDEWVECIPPSMEESTESLMYAAFLDLSAATHYYKIVDLAKAGSVQPGASLDSYGGADEAAERPGNEYRDEVESLVLNERPLVGGRVRGGGGGDGGGGKRPYPTTTSKLPRSSQVVRGSRAEMPPQATDGSLRRRAINVKWLFGGAVADEYKTEEVQGKPLGPEGSSAGYYHQGEYLVIQTLGFSSKKAAEEITIPTELWRRRPLHSEIVALVRFTGYHKFESRTDFDAHRAQTCIKEGSQFDWKEGAQARYAWIIEVVYKFQNPLAVNTGQTAPWVDITFTDDCKVRFFRFEQ